MRDLEYRIKAFPKKKTEHGIKAYCQSIREYFLDFFLRDLLDYKNYNYSHEDIFLSHQRRKKISKEHYDFLKAFSSTQTFKNFQALSKKCSTPDERKFMHLIETFEMSKNKTEEEKKEDVRQVIDLDSYTKHFTFNNLQEKYYLESSFLPIRQIITAQKAVETAFYRYTYFPKLLNVLSVHPNVFMNLNWPKETNGLTKAGAIRDIFSPHPYYTHENIKDIIWLTCWIGTYWYHENAEK